MQSKTQSFIKSFTGWRGLAVLFVCLYHWFPGQIKGGYLGVVIFLTLSGYLVTDSFFSEFRENKKISFRNFYLRRVKRLYPPLIFFVLLTTAWTLIVQDDVLYNFRGSVFTTLFGINNWWQIGQNLSYFHQFSLPGIFTHMWALSVEMQIYLIWPLIVLAIFKWKPRATRRTLTFVSLIGAAVSLIFLAVAYVASDNMTRAYYGTDTRIFSFFLGAAMAGAFSRKRLQNLYRIFSAKAKYIVLAAAGLTILLMFILPGDHWISYFGGMLIFNLLLLTALVGSADPSGLPGRLIANPVFNFLGQRSYSLYLWQYTLLALSKAGFRLSGLPYGAAVLLQILFLLILTEITYQLTEKNLAELLGRFKLRKIKSGARLKSVPVLLATAVLGLCFIITAVKAPAGVPDDVREMQERLANGGKLFSPAEREKQQAKDNAGKNGSSRAENEGNGGTKSPTSSKRDGSEGNLKNTKETGAADGDENIADESKPADGTDEGGNATKEKTGAVKQFSDVIAKHPDLELTEEEAARAGDTQIYAVGDSVLEMCRNDFAQILPNMTIDAAVSRQIPAGIDILRGLKKTNSLPPYVYFALGTNGVANAAMLDKLATEFSDVNIYISTIVTNQDYEENVNKLIRDAASRHRNLHLIDWYKFAKGRTELFYNDGTHPNVSGTPYYVQFVAKNILKAK